MKDTINKWHDLRVDPNDLPVTPRTENEYRVVVGDDGYEYFWNDRDWYTRSDDAEADWVISKHKVIAWCERPMFY